MAPGFALLSGLMFCRFRSMGEMQDFRHLLCAALLFPAVFWTGKVRVMDVFMMQNRILILLIASVLFIERIYLHCILSKFIPDINRIKRFPA